MPPSKSEVAIDTLEFRQSWKILILAVAGVAISINAALLYGFGTLVVPLGDAFGWSKSELQASITFLFGGAVISLQLVGWFNLRYGMKRVTVVSLLLLSLGYLATTLLTGSIWSLYFAFAVYPFLAWVRWQSPGPNCSAFGTTATVGWLWRSGCPAQASRPQPFLH